MTEHTLPHKRPLRQSVNSRPKPIPGASTPSSGQALDTRTQRRMGARFGHDFSQVRIHADSHAAETAQGLGAKAYTQGSDIVFGDGQFAPHSRDGERLLAHELTHVVQQSRFGVGGEERPSRSADASEQEAESAASLVLSGRDVQVRALPQAAVAREGDDSSPTDGQNMLINTAMYAAGLLPGPAGLAGRGLALGLGALGVEEAARQMPKPNDTDADMKKGEGYAGLFSGILGTEASVIGGFDAAAAVGLGAEAGLGAGSVFGGAGLGGAAALGPAGLVLGSGLLGMGAGHLLAEHTEVGANTTGAVGGIDSLLTGDGDRSAMLRMDEYRQDQWDAGGLGYLKSIGAGVGEGAVGLGGAVGGLAEGAYHGLGAIGGGIAGLFE